MLKLGYTLDIGLGSAVVDWNTAGSTGKRVCLKNAQSVIFVASAAVAGGGTDDDVFTLNEHTAKTGGTTTALAKVTDWYIKAAVAMDGTETWTHKTQGAGSTITVAGATYAADQYVMAVQVNTKDLDDTYDYVSLSIADPGSGGSRLGSILAILTDLTVRRAPENLQATLI